MGPEGDDPDDAGAPAGDGEDDVVDVETACHFSITVPADYVDIPVRGIDSCIARFTAGQCEYFADYGTHSAPLMQNTGDSDYQSEAAQIDGRAAEVVALQRGAQPSKYLASVFFARVNAVSAERLSLTATCQSAASQARARIAFQSIRFDN